jgi:hypothetical protein
MNPVPIRRFALSGISAALALATFSILASADEVKFKLTGDAEVPPVSTTASATATIDIKSDMSVSGNVTTAGITATMAHIHIGKAGTNGPVIITLTKMGDNAWLVPEGSKLSDAQYQAYKAGELYVNVHSAEHKPGEIRGQIMPPRAGGYGY